MNRIFYAMILIAFLSAGWRQLHWEAPPPPVAAAPAPLPEVDAPAMKVLVDRIATLEARNAPAPPAAPPSPMEALSSSIFEAAKSAVDLAIKLVGVMAFFLGLMKVAEAGGAMKLIARLIRPLMVRLFPDVPPDHPAMGAIILNLAANALGLANAATPFGIRAMMELDALNRTKGTATNAMALFLAINTSSVTLLPTGVIAMRKISGSTMESAILPTTLFATLCSTTVAILACKLLQRAWPSAEAVTPPDEIVELTGPASDEALEPVEDPFPVAASYAALAVLVAMIPATLIWGSVVSPWIIPVLTVGLLTFGAWRGVAVYEVFVEGARDGWNVAVRIIPFMVAILAAVGMFRASGALDAFVSFVGPYTAPLGMPAEALPMALLRPLSGSGALAVMLSIIQDPAIGPDSYAGFLVSTLQGSTETTFYVLAVYFGAVGIRRIRHAMVAALLADLAGIIGAIIGCTLYFQLNGL